MRTVLESLLDKLTCLEKYEDYVEKLNIEAVKSQNSTNVVGRYRCRLQNIAVITALIHDMLSAGKGRFRDRI